MIRADLRWVKALLRSDAPQDQRHYASATGLMT